MRLDHDPKDGSSFRLGRITFNAGITQSQVISYLIIALFSTCLMASINFMQPFLLTEYLEIPSNQLGVVSGNLVFWNEVVIILCVGVLGSLSDKIGRSGVYAMGFIVLAVTYCLFPHAESIAELTGIRLIFAVGAAAVTAMLATVMADYPQDVSRGKFTGLIGILTGFGIMLIVFVFSKLPTWYAKITPNSKEAGYLSFYTIGAIAFVIALLALTRLNKNVSIENQKKSISALLYEGWKAGKNPKIRFAYAAAFVSGGDLAIVGTFLSLWIVNYHSSAGMSSTEALKQAGIIFGVSQGAALLWAPVIGMMCDRQNRMKALIFALMLATVGYCSLGFIGSPVGLPMIGASILLGMGEISAVIASQALIGEQAKADIRGSVIGAFGVCGAFGILFSTKTGGYLFDKVSPAAPFVMIGIINGIVLLFGLHTLRKARLAKAELLTMDNIKFLSKQGIS